MKHNRALVVDGLLAGRREENEFERKRNARRNRLTKSQGTLAKLMKVEKKTGVRIKLAHLVLSFLGMVGYPVCFVAPYYSSLSLIPKLATVLFCHPVLTEIVVGFFRFKNIKVRCVATLVALPPQRVNLSSCHMLSVLTRIFAWRRYRYTG